MLAPAVVLVAGIVLITLRPWENWGGPARNDSDVTTPTETTSGPVISDHDEPDVRYEKAIFVQNVVDLVAGPMIRQHNWVDVNPPG